MVWIPYFIWEFWEPQTDGVTIVASEQDKTERQFGIWFHLENPPGRQRFVELQLDTAQLQQLKQQTDATGRKAVMKFEADDKGRLKAVGYQLDDEHPKMAFRYCFDSLSRLLSVWTLITGSGFSIWAAVIRDLKHKTEWKVVPQQGAPEPFSMPLGVDMGGEHSAMLSLYREARNTASPFYRFLCCYKILEAWHKHGSIFGHADRIVKEHNLPFARPRRKVTSDILVFSLAFQSRPEFLDVSFGRFFELLGPWRVKVAHALTDAGEFVNFDQYQSHLEMGPIANLTDLVARQVLTDEFELWQKIVDSRVLPGSPKPPA